MDHRRFGASGLTVPVVGLGTWQTFDVRGTTAVTRIRAVVDTALESGITFFDSSPMYGAAERVLARALEGRRGQALVATKVWAPSVAEGRRQVAQALDWYGGVVDVYQVHNLVNWKAQLTVLEAAHEAGQVRVVGATHYSASAFNELRAVMETGRIGAVQIPYNPVQREVERRVPTPEALAPLAVFGVRTWAQALLKWILSDPRCHVAIPATANPAHALENAAAGEPPWFGAEERAYVLKLANAG